MGHRGRGTPADWTHFLVCEPIFCFDSHSTWTQGSLRAEGHHRTPLCGASDVTPGDPPRPTSPSTQMVRCEEGAGWLPSALPCLGAADLVQGSIAPSENRLPMLSPGVLTRDFSQEQEEVYRLAFLTGMNPRYTLHSAGVKRNLTEMREQKLNCNNAQIHGYNCPSKNRNQTTIHLI